VVAPARVLILGGGFVALHTARKLRDAVRAGRAELTVVTRENFLYAHGFAGEMVTGRIAPGTILNPARRIFAPARIHIAELESIDLEGRRVVTSRHLDGARYELEYDHAVLALGSAENLEAYPGLAEHAFKLKRYEDCFRLRNHVIEMLELADMETDPEERSRLLTFFVAGGGFSGTELACELADYLGLLTGREYPRIRREECRVVIVHPGPTLLPELYGASTESRSKSYPRLVDYGMRHAQKLGVELVLETKVVGATPNEVHLSNGERVPTRTIISTVGTKPVAVLAGLPLEKDSRGRVVVGDDLRVVGHENLWAGGDCASVPLPGGGTCPPVATWAIEHGKHVGLNLSRVLAGEETKPFRSGVTGQAVSIGRRTAVGDFKGLPVRGKVAWLGWRALGFKFFPSWDRRLRLLADWSVWPLVGRDIVQMTSSERPDYEIRHNVYQPGEVIADSARPVRYVHVIVEGEVELAGLANGVERTLETIGPGDHFGRKSLEHASADLARARSLVRTVALRAEEANRLQDVLLSTGRIVARTELQPTIDLDALRREREEGGS
jgi:NADH dehydrogenase